MLGLCYWSQWIYSPSSSTWVNQPPSVVSEIAAYYKENKYNNKKNNEGGPERVLVFFSEALVWLFHLQIVQQLLHSLRSKFYTIGFLTGYKKVHI